MGKDKGRTKKQKPFSYKVRQGKDKGKTVKNKTLFSKRVEGKKKKKKEKKGKKKKKKKNILWSYSELLNAIHKNPSRPKRLAVVFHFHEAFLTTTRSSQAFFLLRCLRLSQSVCVCRFILAYWLFL